jgi:hypothetical protein
VIAKKQPQGPIGKSMRLFKLHSNELEPLNFGSVVPPGLPFAFTTHRLCVAKAEKTRISGGISGGTLNGQFSTPKVATRATEISDARPC